MGNRHRLEKMRKTLNKCCNLLFLYTSIKAKIAPSNHFRRHNLFLEIHWFHSRPMVPSIIIVSRARIVDAGYVLACSFWYILVPQIEHELCPALGWYSLYPPSLCSCAAH